MMLGFQQLFALFPPILNNNGEEKEEHESIGEEHMRVTERLPRRLDIFLHSASYFILSRIVLYNH
jgi:hypothetical protein